VCARVPADVLVNVLVHALANALVNTQAGELQGAHPDPLRYHQLQRSLRDPTSTHADCSVTMQVVCLDLEGVLVPEIWIAFAERTGIADFRRTTRDEPDYDKLMRWRLDLLKKHNLKLADIQGVIAGLSPMPGARDFLDTLRSRYQLIILSDTFYEFADPLMVQLGRPTLFCHRLVIDGDGYVADYRLRQPDQKRQAVHALQGLNFKVIAAGDSYNDTAMLGAADAAFLMHAPPHIAAEFPQFALHHDYTSLLASIDAAASRLST
jgi:phosphoserine / homoserine phosphotransferase